MRDVAETGADVALLVEGDREAAHDVHLDDGERAEDESGSDAGRARRAEQPGEARLEHHAGVLPT